MSTYTEGTADTAHASETLISYARYAVTASDSIVVGRAGGDNNGWSFLAGALVYGYERFRSRAQSTQAWQFARTIVETPRISGLIAQTQTTYHLALAERTALLKDLTLLQLGASVSLRVGLRTAASSALATALAERIIISATLAFYSFYGLSVAERIAIQNFLAFGLGAHLIDTIHISSSSSILYQSVAAWADTVTHTANVAFQFQIVTVENEAVQFTDDETLRAIYTGGLVETINCVFDFIESTADDTTWAMNIRTGAVTEYLNYEFNSFAMVNDFYLGASSDGLYELIGDQDQETPIITRMRNGRMELAGSHLAGLKSAYMAINGTGEFHLKLVSATRETVYRVAASPLQSARVNLGKGWRSRYITYELISTGQDYDLTSLEFLPITFVRRTGR